MKHILGGSFDYHDAAPALIAGDQIIAAAQEQPWQGLKDCGGDFVFADSVLPPRVAVTRLLSAVSGTLFTCTV